MSIDSYTTVLSRNLSGRTGTVVPQVVPVLTKSAYLSQILARQPIIQHVGVVGKNKAQWQTNIGWVREKEKGGSPGEMKQKPVSDCIFTWEKTFLLECTHWFNRTGFQVQFMSPHMYTWSSVMKTCQSTAAAGHKESITVFRGTYSLSNGSRYSTENLCVDRKPNSSSGI